jgi:hypothetical protein
MNLSFGQRWAGGEPGQAQPHKGSHPQKSKKSRHQNSLALRSGATAPDAPNTLQSTCQRVVMENGLESQLCAKGPLDMQFGLSYCKKIPKS